MIEMYVGTPWQVRQPWRVPLDLGSSDAEILAETERLITSDGVSSALDDWERQVTARLARPTGRPVNAPEPSDSELHYESIWSSLREVEFRQAFVDAGGVRTRYVESGPSDAPAVVMLHGTGAHWETFARNLGPYGQRYRTIAFDMVGNGFSGRPDHDYEIPEYVAHTLAVMDALGIEHAHLLGTSLGSWVAAALALDHPDRVAKLVFMSVAGLVASEENMERIIATRMKAVDDPNWESIKAMFDHLIADERNRLPDLVSLRQAIYRQPGMTRRCVTHWCCRTTRSATATC